MQPNQAPRNIEKKSNTYPSWQARDGPPSCWPYNVHNGCFGGVCLLNGAPDSLLALQNPCFEPDKAANIQMSDWKDMNLQCWKQTNSLSGGVGSAFRLKPTRITTNSICNRQHMMFTENKGTCTPACINTYHLRLYQHDDKAASIPKLTMTDWCPLINRLAHGPVSFQCNEWPEALYYLLVGPKKTIWSTHERYHMSLYLICRPCRSEAIHSQIMHLWKKTIQQQVFI